MTKWVLQYQIMLLYCQFHILLFFTVACHFLYVFMYSRTDFQYFIDYSKCPKISNPKVSDKMACANSADPDQT